LRLKPIRVINQRLGQLMTNCQPKNKKYKNYFQRTIKSLSKRCWINCSQNHSNDINTFIMYVFFILSIQYLAKHQLDLTKISIKRYNSKEKITQ
jgi:hypothetical protein